MTQPHNMMGGYHVPAMITRDRLNHTLADLELRELVNLLAGKGVTISIGALHAVRFGSTQRVTRALAHSPERCGLSPTNISGLSTTRSSTWPRRMRKRSSTNAGGHGRRCTHEQR